ncbi:hypothetical protein LWI29_010552 [Acer saccharum]|uniref:Uncharacterized protein n=1 Tax=Acer saccharum TaxID=4024 RepID=A0AA39VC10_ACESA|nr:hypothetical protein LWI29_010552 [Acer saccharum]
MNEVKLEWVEEEKEKEEETKENDNEGYDDDDHDSDNNDDSNGDNNDDSNDSDYIDEEEENSTEEEAIKKSRAWKQSGGSIGGSRTRAAVNVEGDSKRIKVEGGSKRINVVNIEEEEEESTIRKSRVRKQSGGNNGGSKKWTAVKVEGGSKRTKTVNIEEEEDEEDESTIKTGRAQKRSGGNTGGYKKGVIVRIEEEKEEEEEEESRDWENSDENNGVSGKMLADKIGRGSTRTCDFLLEEVDVSKYIQPRNPRFIAKLRAGPKRNILVVGAQINIMATASATLSPATFMAAAATTTKARKNMKVNHNISGLNSFGGLKAENGVTSLGVPVCTEQSFAKIVSSLIFKRKKKWRWWCFVINM